LPRSARLTSTDTRTAIRDSIGNARPGNSPAAVYNFLHRGRIKKSRSQLLFGDIRRNSFDDRRRRAVCRASALEVLLSQPDPAQSNESFPLDQGGRIVLKDLYSGRKFRLGASDVVSGYCDFRKNLVRDREVFWHAMSNRVFEQSARVLFGAGSVASVKPNRSDSPPASNFPLGPGDVYVRNGGLFSATGFPLIIYISFAYKMIGNQEQYLLRQLPDWAKVERFDIQARASGDPGKDQMRLMMRALLADRFQLRIRFERREVPVLAFTLAKAGKTGP